MNDFTPPSAPVAPPPGNPADMVSMPATGLLIAGGLGILGQILNLAIHFGLFALSLPFTSNSGMGFSALSSGITVVLSVMGLGVNGFIIYGGLQMKNLQNYTMALIAAIIAVIPCFSPCPCCFVGIAVGIWAIVILVKPEVKAAFAQK